MSCVKKLKLCQEFSTQHIKYSNWISTEKIDIPYTS